MKATDVAMVGEIPAAICNGEFAVESWLAWVGCCMPTLCEEAVVSVVMWAWTDW